MIRKILQTIGDSIIKKIETCESHQVEYYYNLGLKLEKIAIYFKIELQ